MYANRTALAHLGFESREQLQARSSRSIMDDYIVEDEHGKPLSIEDVPSVRLMYGRSAAPLLMRAVHRATGELHWNLLRATPLRNDDGDFIGAITVIEDVTAVKQAEVRTRVLAESGAMLASSLDYQQTLHHVANVAVPALADWCAVDLIDARTSGSGSSPPTGTRPSVHWRLGCAISSPTSWKTGERSPRLCAAASPCSTRQSQTIS